MGDYNPHLPYILGNEWVPIQEPVVKLQRNVNNVELGVGFQLDGATHITDAQMYTGQEKNTEATVYNQINIYPFGKEALSGPIRKAIIPVQSVSVTGTNWDAQDNITVSFCQNGSVIDGPGCNLTNSLSGYGAVTFYYNGNPTNLIQRMAMSFAVNDFEEILEDKRILNVSLLHRGTASARAEDSAGNNNIVVPLQRLPGTIAPTTAIRVVNTPGGSLAQSFQAATREDYTGVLGTGSFTLANEFPNPTTGRVTPTTNALNLGDVTPLWDFPNPSELDRLPWNFDVLSQFDDQSSNRRWIEFLAQVPQVYDGGAVSGTGRVVISYVAIEVTYCDETRIAVGGRQIIPISHEVTTQTNSTVHTMPLHPILNYGSSPVSLDAGIYTIALSSVHPGDTTTAAVDVEYPRISATRPLTPLPSHPIKQIKIPFPFDDTVVGKTFIEEPSTAGVQLSLLNDGNVITYQTHVYGEQEPIPVYGDFVARNFIVNAPLSTVEWPWIRFWARRFGNTAVPLTVTCNGSTASISATEFDALDKITTENWREITLALEPSLVISPPVSGSPDPVEVIWTATGELAGSRWEVLASTAASVSGYVQNRLPHYLSMSPATYGAGINSSWGLVLDDVSGNYASTPDAAALDITGDIFLACEATLNWFDGTYHPLIHKWVEPSNQSYGISIDEGGSPAIVWTTDGTSGTVVFQVSNKTVPFDNGEHGAVAASLDVNNGSGGKTIHYYTGPSINGPWTLLETITSAGTTSIFSGSAPVEAGTYNVGAGDPWLGMIHAIQIRSGDIDGTLILDTRFNEQPPGTTSFTDDTSLPWTINGSAYIGSLAFEGAPITLLDQYPDAAVFLSQEVPPVTGFTLTPATQTLTSIGMDCGDTPCCVPSELYYHRLTWGLPEGTNYILQDLFNRIEEDSWGLPDIYEPDTSPTYSVLNGKGYLDASNPAVSGSGETSIFIDNIGYNYDLTTLITNEKEDLAVAGIIGRSRYEFVAVSVSQYQLYIILPNGSDLLIRDITDANSFTSGIYSSVYVRYLLDDTKWKVKAWPEIIDQPDIWTAEVDVAELNGLALPGASGDYASTPDDASLDITGDIDIRVEFTLGTWPSSSDQMLVSKYYVSGNQRSYALLLNSSRNLEFNWSTDGTVESFEVSDEVLPFSGGDRGAVRVTLDVDNGSSNYTLRFYVASSINGPWTQLGSHESGISTTSIFSGTAPLEISGRDGGTAELFTGVIHAVEVRDGIDGTVVANPVFEGKADGTASFADSAGKTWTINGDAYIINDSAVATESDIELVAFASSFISFQNLTVTPPQYWFGNYEVQRRDEIETEWKTILQATSPALTGFNDYEARAGIVSEYRIRRVNVYNFASEWSPVVTGMIPEPGVVTNDCLENGHLLLFTSNERQDGSINLAYSTAWLDSQVEEGFVFPETDFVQMQAMYDRDFYVAFRPLERGGEQFSRTLLVQAAAIPPETLADFKSLRNMAWDTVNYICVRDEDGNRWLANVQVPNGNVLRNRRLYLAPVNITEVTDTPTPVDPSPWS